MRAYLLARFCSVVFASCRTAQVAGETWYCLADVGRVLGLRNPRMILTRERKQDAEDTEWVCYDDDREVRYQRLPVKTKGGVQQLVFISPAKVKEFIGESCWREHTHTRGKVRRQIHKTELWRALENAFWAGAGVALMAHGNPDLREWAKQREADERTEARLRFELACDQWAGV